MEFNYTITHEEEDADLVKVKVKVCGFEYEQSGLVCFSTDWAKYEIEMLFKFRSCPFVATGYVATPFKDNTGLGMAIIERVSTVYKWIQNTSNLQLWVYDTQCICSTGVDFRKLCFQACRALEVIHDAKNFHGNITKGVLIGTDNNVRVCNFAFRNEGKQPSESCILTCQKEDVRMLVVLLNKLTAQVKIPSDLQHFLDMCEECQTHSFTTLEQFRSYSKWVYNAPFFWKPAKILFFFDVLYELVGSNSSRLNWANFLKSKYSGWAYVLWDTNESSFHDCLTFKAAPHERRTRSGIDFEYRVPFGILTFIKNYKKHHKWGRTQTEVVKSVTCCFPHLLEDIYFEVMRLKDLLLVSKLRNVKTLSSILWENPSVFNMNNCC